jgi:hypothetical protein
LLAEANATAERLVLVSTPRYDPEANRVEWLWRARRRAVTPNHQRATLAPLLADADRWAATLPARRRGEPNRQFRRLRPRTHLCRVT